MTAALNNFIQREACNIINIITMKSIYRTLLAFNIEDSSFAK